MLAFPFQKVEITASVAVRIGLAGFWSLFVYRTTAGVGVKEGAAFVEDGVFFQDQEQLLFEFLVGYGVGTDECFGWERHVFGDLLGFLVGQVDFIIGAAVSRATAAVVDWNCLHFVEVMYWIDVGSGFLFFPIINGSFGFS